MLQSSHRWVQARSCSARRSSKRPASRRIFFCLESRLRDGLIARGIQGDNLFDANGLAFLDLAGEVVRDVIREETNLVLRVDRLRIAIQEGTGRFGHMQERLIGPAE
jgi:hypothetical protein